MSFEFFRKGVLATFEEYMEEIGAFGTVREEIVERANHKLHGLVFLFERVDGISYEDCAVFPTIYLEDMYGEYCSSEDGDLDAILKRCALLLKELFLKNASTYLPDLSDAANMVVAQLVNTQRNASLLAGVPSRKWNDLSIIYRIFVDSDKIGRGSIMVTNVLAKQLGFTEEQLYELSLRNMPQLLPTEIMDMADLFEGPDVESGLVRVSNIYDFFGAAAILDGTALRELSKKFGGDLYLMPASIHEFLVVKADELMLDELAQTVKESNECVLPEEEYLSDQVYIYKQDTGEVTCLLGEVTTVTFGE